MKPNSCEIVFVVDRSGSMQSIANDMRGAFDAFIAEQRQIPGECRVTLARFDNEFEIPFAGLQLADVPPLRLEPRGGTALLDAIGKMIDATGGRLAHTPEQFRPSRVVFVVITDGEENASQLYTHARVMEMIKIQRERYSWDFVFLGANQDAIKVGNALGVNVAMNFVPDCATSAVQSLSSNVGSLRNHGVELTSGSMKAVYEANVAASKGTAGSEEP